MLTSLLVLLAAGYAAILIALYFAQTGLLFPGVQSASPLPEAAEHLLVENAGERLHGVHIPGGKGGAGDDDGPVLLAFGGNVWNADAAAVYLREVLPRADIVIFHYRGYPPSTGRPSASALRADALPIHDAVARMFPGRPIVVAGFSLGSGVAAHLARHRRFAGLILVTPFDSLGKVAGHQYPWVPVRLLFRHGMDAAADLGEVDTPVAVIAAEHDRLIPRQRTDALRRAIPRLVFDRTIVGMGHVDLYEDAAFKRAMAEALEAVSAAYRTTS